MNSINKIIISLFVCLIFLSSCQSLKDGLTGKKQNNNDEFLVKKKNPLVQPPEFSKLPNPSSSLKDQKKIDNNEDINLEVILGKSANSTKVIPKTQSSTSLEKSILEKIKD